MVLATFIGIGLGTYVASKKAGQRQISIGDAGQAKVEVKVWIQKVDAVAQIATLAVLILPRGDLADPDYSLAFTKPVTVENFSVKGTPFNVKANELIPTSFEMQVGMGKGSVTDYPFDQYELEIFFAAHPTEDLATLLPVTVTL